LKRSVSALFGVALVISVFATGAQAATLGSAVQPPDSNPNGCPPNSVVAQATSDPGTPYSAPGPGTITQWQTDASLSSLGSGVTFVVLKPVGAEFTVVGTDARTIPAATGGDIVTFLLPNPINVSGGETIGLYTSGAPVVCDFNAGDTPLTNTLAGLGATSPPAPGQTLGRATNDSPPGYTMNLAANFAPAPPATPKKKCKKPKKKRSAESAKKKKCKKKTKG
jgi:hypothetical protein